MSSMDEETEIGRGRQADSSSSRDSSPQRTHNRSFTPVSDDDGVVAPPVQDEDTPPPDGPILRQALGFSGLKPTTIAQVNTYEAIPSQSSQALFLPGQEVGSVPRATPTSMTRAPRSRKNRPRLNSEFSSQTGSFRLMGYVNDPKASSVEPPTHCGTGPYSSMYRVTPPPRTDDASAAGSPPSHRRKKSIQHTGTASSSGASQQAPLSEPPRSTPSGHDGRQASNSFIRPVGSSDRRKKSTHSVASQHSRSSSASSQTLHAHQDSISRPLPSVHDGRLSQLSSAFSQRPPSVRSRNTGHSMSSSGPRGNMRQMRMLTILLEDMRSAVTDHQLAEVKVPLRLAENPEDGYWADAIDISNALQSGPSRIDGPAKAYTLRGKYRQIFMRISGDNALDCTPANIIVTPQRTLDVFVEPNPPPGVRMRTPTPEREPSTTFEPDTQTLVIRDSEDIRRMTTHDIIDRYNAGKRKFSSSFDDYDSAEPSSSTQHHVRRSPSRTLTSSHMSPYVSPSQTPLSMYQAAPTSKKQRGYPTGFSGGAGAADGSHSHRAHIPKRHYTPDPSASREEVDDAIVGVIQSKITDDPEWIEFMKLKSIPQPHALSIDMQKYQLAQKMMDKWGGERAPFESPSHYTINKSHVLKALFMDEQWGSDCTETLHLLSLYGRDGRHYEDSRVTDMVDGVTPGKSPKQLLKLLRKIDKDRANDEGSSHEASSN